MRIGIDFDNTLIDYHGVFNAVGQELGLIPDTLETGKNYVKTYLISQGREDQWTELQGIVYGSRLGYANPYKGFFAFLSCCRKHSIECVIVSHKTRYPYIGEKVDLHQAAKEWLAAQQITLDTFFELTKEDKVRRIASLGCDLFVDDLPDFLSLPGFPEHTQKLLFDPRFSLSVPEKDAGFLIVRSWAEIREWVEERH